MFKVAALAREEVLGSLGLSRSSGCCRAATMSAQARQLKLLDSSSHPSAALRLHLRSRSLEDLVTGLWVPGPWLNYCLSGREALLRASKPWSQRSFCTA